MSVEQTAPSWLEGADADKPAAWSPGPAQELKLPSLLGPRLASLGAGVSLSIKAAAEG